MRHPIWILALLNLLLIVYVVSQKSGLAPLETDIATVSEAPVAGESETGEQSQHRPLAARTGSGDATVAHTEPTDKTEADIDDGPVIRSIPNDLIVPIRVRSGDTLSELGQRYNITVSFLRALNDLRGDLIQAGDTIHVVDGPFRAELDCRDGIFQIVLSDTVLKTYPIRTEREIQPNLYSVVSKRRDRRSRQNRWLEMRGFAIVPREWSNHLNAPNKVQLPGKAVQEIYDLLVIGSPIAVH